MHASSRLRRGALAASILAVPAGLLAISSLRAGSTPSPNLVASASMGYSGGIGGLGLVERAGPPTTVYVQRPVSGEAARIWLALDRPIAMPFGAETPLGDVLQYVRSATESEDHPQGLPFYVEPTGLIEAEKTMQSPVTIHLDGVPLRISLTLALGQLGLSYTVHDEGLVVIDYADFPQSPLTDRSVGTLEELERIRSEIHLLRLELNSVRGAIDSALAPPAEPPVEAPESNGGFR